MKFKCDKNLLLESLNIVSKAVAIRSSKEIFECILFEVNSSGVKLTATDLQMGIESKEIAAEVEVTGSVALEAKLLIEIIRKMPLDEINFSVDDNLITTISSGKAEFKVLASSSEDFSKIDFIDKTNSCTVLSHEFKNMIKQTIFSVSIDDSKPVFCGETLIIENGVLVLYSLDSFRISYRQTIIENKALKASLVIPTKSLSELNKILTVDENDTLNIFFTENHVMFETKDCTMVSRLIEGTPFNYSNAFSNEYSTIVHINKEELLTSFERTSLICKDVKKNPVKLTIQENSVSLTINTETGTSKDEINIEKDGDNLEIAFNPKYFIEALKVIDEVDVSLYMTSPLSPCTVLSKENPNFKYLILPLRI